MKIIFKVNNDLFIQDDGYSYIAQKFFNGNVSLAGNVLGPVLPLIFSVIYFFPDFLVPVARLIITQLFTLGNLFFAFLIFSKLFAKYGSNINKYLFYGLLLFVANPMYLYFTLKSTPEIYIIFFLLGTIYYTYLLIENNKLQYLFLCIFLYGISIFLKPVLILIPLILLIFYLFKKRIKVSLLLLIIVFMNMVFFLSFIKFAESKSEEKYNDYSNVDYAYIIYTYLVKNIVQTGNISTGTRDIGNGIEEKNHAISRLKLNEFLEANKNNNFFERNIGFIKDEPFWFVIARLLSPIFFFSLYSSTKTTIVFFLLNMIIIAPGFNAIRNIYKNIEDKLILNIVVLSMAGYFLLFFLTYSYVRYSVPIISIVSVFSTFYMYNIYLNKIRKI